MATTPNFEQMMRHLLTDIRVAVDDEFDQNFTRQAFFSQKWQRVQRPSRTDKNILMDSGALRRSFRGRVNNQSITWESTLPYASIHNDGGEITVTERMKKFFWYKHCSTKERFDRKKNGRVSNNKRTKALTAEAEFWKRLALMKVGSRIKIPKRQFLGSSPEMERIVEEIIESNVNNYLDSFDILW